MLIAHSIEIVGMHQPLDQGKYFFPVNHRGNHWIVVYADLLNGHISAINPINPQNADVYSLNIAFQLGSFFN